MLGRRGTAVLPPAPETAGIRTAVPTTLADAQLRHSDGSSSVVPDARNLQTRAHSQYVPFAKAGTRTLRFIPPNEAIAKLCKEPTLIG